MIAVSIDRGVPTPPPTRTGRPPTYPWRTMKVGDSFQWPGGTLQQAKETCKQRRRRHGERYRVAKVTEDGKHLIRVWRLS